MKLTASQVEAKCIAAGCSKADFDKLAALPGIDFATLLQLIITYGPQIVAVLLALFGHQPAPTPLPLLPSPQP